MCNVTGDINIPALFLLTIHKDPHNHLGGSVTQFVTALHTFHKTNFALSVHTTQHHDTTNRWCKWHYVTSQQFFVILLWGISPHNIKINVDIKGIYFIYEWENSNEHRFIRTCIKTPPGIFFVLRWQFSPTQAKYTCNTNNSTCIVYGLSIKMRNI